MQLKTFLFDEDRGVSPVIGVILMVAITVILAAVIATFVMNMGPGEETQPNSQFSWNTDTSGADPVAVIEHDGGDPLPVGEYSVQLDPASGSSESDNLEDTGGSYSSGDEMTAGDELEISSVDGTDLDDGDELTLVWENPNNDQTQEVDTYEIDG